MTPKEEREKEGSLEAAAEVYQGHFSEKHLFRTVEPRIDEGSAVLYCNSSLSFFVSLPLKSRTCSVNNRRRHIYNRKICTRTLFYARAVVLRLELEVKRRTHFAVDSSSPESKGDAKNNKKCTTAASMQYIDRKGALANCLCK